MTPSREPAPARITFCATCQHGSDLHARVHGLWRSRRAAIEVQVQAVRGGKVKPTPSLFPDLVPSVARREFLPDLLRGSIAEAWAQVVTHWLPPPATVADLTCRYGAMWSRCAAGYRVLRFDVDPSVRPEAHADCRWPAIRRATVDGLVVDVPWSLDPGKGDGYAAEAYGSRFTRIEQVLDLFRGPNWAACVRPGGWAFVRIQDCHHAGRYVPYSHEIPKRVACAAWEFWDEVIHEIGGHGAQAGMVDPPKTRKGTSRWQVYRRTRP